MKQRCLGHLGRYTFLPAVYPPHFTSISFQSRFGKTNPVLHDGATSPAIDLVEMEKKSSAGVQDVDIEMVPCPEERNTGQVENLNQSSSHLHME